MFPLKAEWSARLRGSGTALSDSSLDHLGMTEAAPAGCVQGVVVLSMSDVPLGFGTSARSTQECRKLDPSAIVTFHQADTGEYLRSEDDNL